MKILISLIFPEEPRSSIAKFDKKFSIVTLYFKDIFFNKFSSQFFCNENLMCVNIVDCRSFHNFHSFFHNFCV